MADDKSDGNSAVLERALAIATEQDTFEANAFLQSQGAPAAVADLYSHLLRKLYFEKKNVPLMTMLGRSGIDYALAQARTVEASHPDAAVKLKGIAKEIAYNLGANTWPGWNDEGIVISKSDLAAGLDAARLNLRLAGELKRSDEAVANAHWLLGAHQLAAGQARAARDSFAASAARFHAASNTQSEAMAKGYVGIAEMSVESSRDAGKKTLDAAIDALRKDGSDDAKFYAEQLKTAAKLFVK